MTPDTPRSSTRPLDHRRHKSGRVWHCRIPQAALTRPWSGISQNRRGVPVAEAERWLNERSGLLGVSGSSLDMRELLGREPHDARAQLAVELFCYRARKYVGAYLAALGGAEALIFTGGIGENSPDVRARLTHGLDWFGLALDAERNRSAIGQEGRIGTETARVQALVIPTDKELVIAQDAVTSLGAGRAERGRPA